MIKDCLKKIRRTLRFYLIKALVESMALLPTSKIGKLKLLFIKLIKIFGKKECQRAEEFLPKEFEDRKKEIIHGMIENQALTLLEIIFYDKLMKDNPNFCRFEGLGFIEELQKNGKVPCILAGHFCNWEVLAYELIRAGLDMTVIARPNNLDQMTDFINNIRAKHGVKVVMHNNIIEGIKLLKSGKSVGIVADLNAREWGYQVDFFGRNASFYSAPAIISVRSKMPLVPVFAERQPDGCLLMNVYKPIEWESGESMKDRVQKVAKVYEAEYRKRPDLWCWFHDRYSFAEMGKLK